MFGPPKIARPSCEIPDSAVLGTTLYTCASMVIPTNIAIARVAIVTSVEAAFLASGGLNAGTPFETASTPVIAVQPFANAVSSRNNVSDSCVEATGGMGGRGWTEPVTARQVPTATRVRIVTIKKYVGIEKILPDSR